MDDNPLVGVAVEGESDRGMVETLLTHVGLRFDTTKWATKKGSRNLDVLIRKFSRATLAEPWVVFRDTDGRCPVDLQRGPLEEAQPIEEASPSRKFLLQLVHPMTESWLLADTAGFASHFQIKHHRVPRDPESLSHAKATLLGLCQESQSRLVRKDMVCHDQPGPLYVLRLHEYARERWNAAVAAQASPSLKRAVSRLQTWRESLLAH